MENPEQQNNTEHSSSTHKTRIEQEAVISFLESHNKEPVSNIEIVAGGEGSQAFSFESNREDLILRMNRHSEEGFKKDEYAFNNFESQEIPIPEINEIGKTEDDQYFAISKKVNGKMFKNLSLEELNEALPSLFSVLDAIHSIDVSDSGGYGKWNSEGVGENQSWKDMILSVDMYAKHMFENSILEKEVWDKIYDRLVELTQYCPEEKYLIHGDYTTDNIIAKNGKVEGVLDWADSRYGDYLYDIAPLSFWEKEF